MDHILFFYDEKKSNNSLIKITHFFNKNAEESFSEYKDLFIDL